MHSTLVDNIFSSIYSIKNDKLLSDTSDYLPVGILFRVLRLPQQSILLNRMRFFYSPAVLDRLKEDSSKISWDFASPDYTNLDSYTRFLISFVIPVRKNPKVPDSFHSKLFRKAGNYRAQIPP